MDELLFVSPRFLFPADSGGKIRTTQVLKGLRGGRFRITLVSPATAEDLDRYKDDVAAVCDEFVHWSHGGASPAHRIKRVLSVLSTLPVSVASDRSEVGKAKIAQLITKKPAVVVFDFPHSAVLSPTDIQVPTILFTHNVESWIFERHVKVAGNFLTRLLWQDQFKKMKRFEQETLRRFDAVVSVSENDAAWFRKELGLDTVSVIPTGVDLDFFNWQPPSARPQVMFIGSMDWPANQDGMMFFMREVWPLVASRVPEALMKVIGRKPPPRLVSRAPKGWEFTGFVDDVRPHAAGSAVSVIPLRVGGGTRIKVYEAMALGVPVVSTTIGVEGLPVNDKEHYLEADGAEDFANAIIRLLGNPTLRATLSRQARTLVESRFSNREVARVFEGVCVAAARMCPPESFAKLPLPKPAEGFSSS